MRVLVVEDDELIARGIVTGLRVHGMAADHVHDAKSAEIACAENLFDAIVLDLGLPDRDGIHLLESLRASERSLPVLILTARDGIEPRVAALYSGADDYMVKPFDLRELAARLHTIIRRANGRSTQAIARGPLRIEPQSGSVSYAGHEVELSRREIDLLIQLANADGRWVPPDVLRDRLYGLGEEVSSNVVNVHIHNIRRKLGNDVIKTSRGLGYRLGCDTAQQEDQMTPDMRTK